ncbi:alpha-galactosidase [Muricomes sp. OA1]|uniref:Alpha-galactosidase n=1 Tax=Hungatella hathewayi TaxID=154046 RepID=A0A3E2WFD7_9FIRM|nr:MULTISPECIES: alpha-galactosidase [Clostridia]MCH1975091.1 alpha-galactosidase [Muricomes sp. OA1]RGC24565.1 alpha-galactosidase [Hungatella hathewayi]GKH33921.1 alpha-galactosidase [Faecalicatena contorta]
MTASIIFHEDSREFHLCNDKISYIMTILKNGELGQLYFGKSLRDRESFGHLLELQKRPMSACAFPGDQSFSMEHIRQEYPLFGHGDMRYPAYEIEQANGSRITEFVYRSHKIYVGKPKLEQLPATYTELDEEAQTLEVELEDSLIRTRLVLTYTIYRDYPVITRNARFECGLPEGIRLNTAMSSSLDLPDMDYEMVELTGAWSRERAVRNRKLEHGIQSIYSMRGCSSNNYNPFLALKRPGTDENSGEVYGFSLVYSGNFLAQAEVDTYHVTRVLMGIHPSGFQWSLQDGESFQTPEAVMVYSDAGLNGMSQTYHELYRTRLARGVWRDRVRPILINNWEATYFNFNEEKILALANTAKQLGIELFVLDDGWFGRRDDDTSSLGDWYPDKRKLPAGVTGIAEKVKALGMDFGLWFEPEMVNEDSQLFKMHPDWVLKTPGRYISYGRNQMVLDFSKEEVVDYIYSMMEKILTEADISYIKWDMNRCMTEVFSSGKNADEQGKVYHQYILGVYRLYERLVEKFPEVLFESCASGGARFDPGMLYYAPQCWTSDDTDAMERLKIQYGTSMVYPLSSMGSHVSAIPNHQLHRNVPMNSRANVAYFGTFGYELDLNELTEEERDTIKNQVQFMKKHRKLIQQGNFYRLISPFEGDGNETAWMVVSPDQTEALLGYYRVLQEVNVGYRRLRLQGLDENMLYQTECSEKNGIYYGDELLRAGWNLSDESCGEDSSFYNGVNGDYQSRIYYFHKYYT